VSLNAQDEETYNRVCKPKFSNIYKSILDFIEKAKEKFDIEITAVTIPEANIQEVREIAQRIDMKFRLREHIPCFL